MIDKEYFRQTEGVPMGSPLSPVIADLYMEFFEKMAIDTKQRQPRGGSTGSQAGCNLLNALLHSWHTFH
jgi:hypothetical protein